MEAEVSIRDKHVSWYKGQYQLNTESFFYRRTEHGALPRSKPASSEISRDSCGAQVGEIWTPCT